MPALARLTLFGLAVAHTRRDVLAELRAWGRPFGRTRITDSEDSRSRFRLTAGVLRQHRESEPRRFADGPCLERTSLRRVGRLRIRDLAEMPQAELVQMTEERFEEPAAGLRPRVRRSAAHAHPCLDERTHEPGPHRALVICAVAR